MTKPKILVTSAAGRTGAFTVQELLKKGFSVRAMVRRQDHRAKALAQAGAEVVVGDLFDMRDLRSALHGVQRAYHCPPFAPNLLHGAALFALAAQEARLEVVALMSGWNPHSTHPSITTREHWIANQLYRWMPSVDVVHINPGLFAFVYLLGLPAITHFGMLAAPFGEGLNAPPSNEDIARVAAAVLADPHDHIGKSYRPTGPELISGHDAAQTLTTLLGRKVTYNPVSIKMFTKAALAQGFPLFEISQIRQYAIELQHGTFAIGAPTDHVERITGSAPEDFATIAGRYIAKPELINPGLSVGSKLEAYAFLFKMLTKRPPDLDRWERERHHPLLTNPVFAHDSSEWRATATHEKLNLLPDVSPTMP